MLDFNIPDVFKAFLHQEIEVTRNPGAGQNGESAHRVAEGDKVIGALADTARSRGMKLEVCFPDTILSFDQRPDRLSIDIEQKDNGRWAIMHLHIG